MDSSFKFLSAAQADLLNEILARRNSALIKRIRESNTVSRADAERILAAISDELNENLDDDWEPTTYGQSVSSLLAAFNAARINEWP